MNTHQIYYVTGDATDPDKQMGLGVRIIPHVCNDAGGWGAGFVNAVSAKWDGPEQAYRRLWHHAKSTGRTELVLGMVQIVDVGSHIHVANMVAQRGFGGSTNGIPLDYAALNTCLAELGQHAQALAPRSGVSFHCPRFGTGLAGGTWDKIEPMIQCHLVPVGNVWVYEYAGKFATTGDRVLKHTRE